MRWVSAVLLFGGMAGAAAAEPPLTPAAFDAAYAALESARGTIPETTRVRELFDLSWRYQMVESPEFATAVGQAGFNDRWSDLSLQAQERRRREATRPLRVLATVDRSALPADEALSLALFERLQEEQVAGLRYPEELLAINQMGGPQQEIAQILTLNPLRNRADAEALLARLRGVGPRVDAVMALLRRGLALGVTPPRITLRDVPQQVLGNIPEAPEDSPLFRPFRSLPAALPEADRNRLAATARDILLQSAYPAFRELHRFLVEEYLPGARTSTAATALPQGGQ